MGSPLIAIYHTNQGWVCDAKGSKEELKYYSSMQDAMHAAYSKQPEHPTARMRKVDSPLAW